MSQGVVQLNFASSFWLIVLNLCAFSWDTNMLSVEPQMCKFFANLQLSSFPTMDEEQKEEGRDKPTKTLW